MNTSRNIASIAALGLLLAAGCGPSSKAYFVLNEVDLATLEFTPEQQQSVSDVLYAMFGTPDEPFVLKETGLDEQEVKLASGPVSSDDKGHGRGLYRQHCAHCHGTTGDGNGPTAALLNPYPRDYRPGKFKFKSTLLPAEPTDGDLERVLRDGVPGTAMPSFDLLPDDEVAALVEYVKYLSMRGQTELALAEKISDLGEGEKLPTDHATLVEEILVPIAQKWQDANKPYEPDDAETLVIEPPAKPDLSLEDSVARGRHLFYGARANCVKCHGPSELGDGQTDNYDDWMKPLYEAGKKVSEGLATIPDDKEMTDEEKKQSLASLHELQRALEYTALKPRTVIPRNLRQGIYRGGRRPLDLYRRISAGINGVGMPGMGPPTNAPGAQSALQPDEIWNLVDYVRSLPFESLSQPRRAAPSLGREAL